ncbi:MAG: class I SAM-dependent methyltransferase [Niabella sp.]|nr:class I SAM-dependent methyltransferase [Niabella sp.]
MDIGEAKNMIRALPLSKTVPQLWADLGCGSGLFTRALISLLPSRSTVYAFDKSPQVFNDPGIHFFQLDFERNTLPVPPLSGILMANSLHYIGDQLKLIGRLKSLLQPDGIIALIEYDTQEANPWVPYPVPSQRARTLATGTGFKNFSLLSTKRSVYQEGGMYLAAIS